MDGIIGEVRFTVTVTDKEGQSKEYEMVGAVNEQQLEQLLKEQQE